MADLKVRTTLEWRTSRSALLAQGGPQRSALLPCNMYAAVSIDEKLLQRLFRQARGERWQTSRDLFARALEASVERAFGGRAPQSDELERYAGSLHLEDLALACACASGDEEAWGQFVLEQRPMLYRTADALDPSGGARDLADSLYADLFGLGNQSGERQSLFRYFHGRSSLATWLRAVLSQRHVDRLRANRRLEALPDEDSACALQAPAHPIEPHRRRYQELTQKALKRAVAKLDRTRPPSVGLLLCARSDACADEPAAGRA